MSTNKNATCPVKTDLDLKPTGDGRWIDQYGRVLEVYTNSEGKLDLRPVGVGY
jgi:hypothetical protein